MNESTIFVMFIISTNVRFSMAAKRKLSNLEAFEKYIKQHKSDRQAAREFLDDEV